jgi:hypothetical protein
MPKFQKKRQREGEREMGRHCDRVADTGRGRGRQLLQQVRSYHTSSYLVRGTLRKVVLGKHFLK